MPKKTAEEKEAYRQILEKEKPAFRAMQEDEQAKQRQWGEEIAMLERRVSTEYEEVDLGGGDTIAVRTALSETESARLGELYQAWFSPLDLEQVTPEDIAQRKEIGYEIVALITANPLITVDWLRENPDRFSTDDAVGIMLSWLEQRQNRENRRAARLVSVASFRPQQTRPELRGIPALHEDTRPERMG